MRNSGRSLGILPIKSCYSFRAKVAVCVATKGLKLGTSI
jgi:hypothetical protein